MSEKNFGVALGTQKFPRTLIPAEQCESDN